MNKYISVLILIFLTSHTIKAQDSSFVIHGNLEKIKSGTIYLNIYEDEKTLKDSAVIKNGIFKFTGFVPSPFFATLTMPSKPGDYYTFYIEPVSMSVSGRADSLRFLNVKGSSVNDDNKMLKERMKTISLWEAANSKLYEG